MWKKRASAQGHCEKEPPQRRDEHLLSRAGAGTWSALEAPNSGAILGAGTLDGLTHEAQPGVDPRLTSLGANNRVASSE